MAATPLWTPFSVTLDGTGAGSFSFGAPPLGYSWQGYITLGDQASGQSFKVTVAGSVLAWGSTQSGLFNAGSGQTVDIAISGGPASTEISGVLAGTIYNSSQAPQVPAAQGSLVQISGGNITLQASDVTISAGQNGVNVSVNQPPVALGSIQDSGGGTTATFTLPEGTHSIGLGVGGAATDLSVYGTTSGILYVPVLPVGSTIPEGYYVVPISGSTDTQVSVTYKVQAGTNTCYVSAILDTQAVDTWPGLIADKVVGTQGASGASVQTVPEAPQYSIKVGYASTAGGTETLISGVAGKSIRIRAVALSSTGTGANELDLQSPSGTPFGSHNVQVGTNWDQDFQGYALPAGDGLYLYTTAAATILGAITYDVY